jgi:hypothetical protein
MCVGATLSYRLFETAVVVILTAGDIITAEFSLSPTNTLLHVKFPLSHTTRKIQNDTLGSVKKRKK